MEDIGDVLDLDRYPLDRPASPRGRALVAECRAALDRDGLFNLEGLMRPAAVARCVADLKPHDGDRLLPARPLAQRLFPGPASRARRRTTPALRRFETVNRTLCEDRMTGTAVHRIYEWTPLAGFLARVLRKPRLYLMDDPAGPRQRHVLPHTAKRSTGISTARSSPPPCCCKRRTPAASSSTRSGLRTRRPTRIRTAWPGSWTARDPRSPFPDNWRPGTLNVFKGRNTAHRTSPVIGPRERMIAVFSYYERPGVLFSDEERIGFYGRAG